MLKFKVNINVYKGCRPVPECVPGIPVIFAILLLIFASCTTTKNIQKSSDKTETKTDLKTVEVSTVTTITEGEIIQPKDSLEAWEPIIDLEKHDLITEDEKTKTVVHEDHGKITVKTIEKAVKVPVKITTTSVTTRTLTEHQDAKEDKKEVVKQVKRSYWSWWYLLLLLIPVGWWLRSKLKSL